METDEGTTDELEAAAESGWLAEQVELITLEDGFEG